MKSLQIAATGMAAQQMRVDVISNNIANMSTAAYRPRVAGGWVWSAGVQVSVGRSGAGSQPTMPAIARTPTSRTRFRTPRW